MKKIILAAVVGLALASGAVYWVYRAPGTVLTPRDVPIIVAQPLATPSASPGPGLATAGIPEIAPIKTLTELTSALDEIDALGKAKTPESLNRLVAYAILPNEDVSSPAQDALVRRGDASVSPLLRAATKKMDDHRQAVVLLDLADYLELPPMDLKALRKRPENPNRVRKNNSPAAEALDTQSAGAPAPVVPPVVQ